MSQGEGPGTRQGWNQAGMGVGISQSSALDLAAGRIPPAAAVQRLLATVEWAVLESVCLAAGGPAQGTHVMPQDGAHHHAVWGLQLV